MALTLEWQHRLERWQRALWDACHQPLGTVALAGFTTPDYLTAEQAAARAFHPMPPGTPWGAKWEYGWFRASIVIPPEAAGQRVVIRPDPGGLESLVWVNGQAAGSLGWARKEITLTAAATPGDRYDILLESYAGHGRITVGDGPYPDGVESVPEPGPTQTAVRESTFGIWREEVYQAAVDFTTLFELSQRLDPLSLRAAEIDEGLMAASLIIDPELSEAEMLATVRAGRAAMKPLLDSKNGPTMPALFAFGHAHIDVAWLWALEHTEHKIAATVLNQLALFEEYPEYKFLQSQPHLYRMLQQRYPNVFRRFVAAVQAGRAIADGAMWVEADTNISGGEALIRQILYGRAFFRDELDVDSRILWLPDVFGYSGALPQILVGCGLAGFATQKITWAYNGGDPFPYNTFWWEGIDGTAIPAHIFSDYNSELRPSAVLDRWNGRLQKNGVKSLIMAFGWGDGGGGPTRDHLEFYRRVRDLEGLPRVRMASPAEFFADLERQGLPKERYVGELYFQAHRGTYTSQARTKRGNRKSEFALREAELWGIAARALTGFDFTSHTLWPAWQNVLLNQFHDILPGSSIHRVYEEAEALHAQAIAQAEDVARAAAGAIAAAGEGRTAFNSLSWPRTALVEANGGPVEVALPACGWAVVPEAPAETVEGASGAARASVAVTTDGFILENELLAGRFDRQGQLVSLWDKAAGRELMAGPGNRLCLYKDVPGNWDAWDVDSMAELQPMPTAEPAEITLVAAGPLVASVHLRRPLHHSTVEQVISLRRGSRRLDFATTVDWQEHHKLLKVAFPVAIHATEAISEIQFGHLRRPNHRSRPHDADRFEVSNHKWTALVEEGRGAAVLNDCKYGLSARGNSINLTLLRAPMAPDMTADRGIQTFTYALYTWNGGLLESGVVREAYDVNVPPLVVPGTPAEPVRSLFSVDAANVVMETIKPAEDGSDDVILRFYESMRTATRCTLTTTLPIKTASLTNLVEETDGGRLELKDGAVVLDFRPFEIKTVRVQL